MSLMVVRIALGPMVGPWLQVQSQVGCWQVVQWVGVWGLGGEWVSG